jgi:hypothetical protein
MTVGVFETQNWRETKAEKKLKWRRRIDRGERKRGKEVMGDKGSSGVDFIETEKTLSRVDY